MQEILLKREWMVQNSWGDLYPTTPSLCMVEFTSIVIDLPKENLKNEHMLASATFWIFFEPL